MLTRAYALRDRASAIEAFRIRMDYQVIVIGNLDQALATYQEWRANYPRENTPNNRVMVLYALKGQLEMARDIALQDARLFPSLFNYASALVLLRVNGQFDDARATIDQALERKVVTEPFAHSQRLLMAFIQGNAGEMAEHTAWFAARKLSIAPNVRIAMEFRAGHLKALHDMARPADTNPGANNPNAELLALQRTFAGLLDAARGRRRLVAPAGAGGTRSGGRQPRREKSRGLHLRARRRCHACDDACR